MPVVRAVRRRVLVGYCLVAAGTVAALVGVVVALVANIPGDGVNEYQRTGNRDDPDPWLGWLAIGLALAFLGWAWLAWRLRPGRWARDARQRWLAEAAPDTTATGERRKWVTRLAAGAAMALAGMAGLVVVAVRMPRPDPGAGPDLSFPLVLSGTAAVVLGMVMVAAGELVRRPADPREPLPRTRLATAAAAGAAAVLAVVLAVLVVPAWAVAANTTATTTSAGPPEDRAPVLDGTVAWSTARPGEASARGRASPDLEALQLGAASVAELLRYNHRVSLRGTAGGLAVIEPRGVRMLDPATGARRWSLHRWDARHFGPRHTRDTAHTGTAVVSPDGRWLAMTMFVDTPRSLLIDDLRARTRVWVLDTTSGERLVDAAVPDSARVAAVDRGRVAYTIEVAEGDGEDGRVLALLKRDGTEAWRHSPDGQCRPTGVMPVEDDLLALVNCADQGTRLWRVDSDTGARDWTWQAEAALGRAGSLAVAGPTAVVSLEDEDESAATRLLAGIRLSGGAEAWRRPPDDPGASPSEAGRAGTGSLRAVAGTVVFTERRNGVVVRAFDAATGRPAWTARIASTPGLKFGVPTGPDLMLADGRFLLAYGDPANDDRCVLGVWDAATGQQRDRITLVVGGNQPRCGSLNVVLVRAPGAVVAWQPDIGVTRGGSWLAVFG